MARLPCRSSLTRNSAHRCCVLRHCARCVLVCDCLTDMRKSAFIILLGLNAVLAACADSSERVLGIKATGDVRGSAYLDRDGDGRRTPVDSVFRGLRVAILPNNGGPALATVTTDSL